MAQTDLRLKGTPVDTLNADGTWDRLASITQLLHYAASHVWSAADQAAPDSPLHDLGPGLLLVREAGGRDSDGAGGDPLVSQHVVVAGAPRVHDGLVALLGRDG